MAARLTAVAVALIVGVTLVAGLLVGAQRDDETGPVDVLIYNGRVYTGEIATPFAEALAIRGNRIYRVGSNRQIKRLRRLATTVIDAHGGSVLAGFTEAPAHLPVGEPAINPEQTTAPAGPGATPPPVDGAAVDQDSAPASPATLKDAIEGAHRLGVTSLNTIVESTGDLRAYEAGPDGTSVPLRIVAALRVEAPVEASTLATLKALRAAHANDPLLRADAVALRVRLASDESRHSGKSGRVHTTPAATAARMPEATERALEEFDRDGWTIVLQVEDERTLAAAVDGLARLAKGTSAPAGGRRHRIEIARPMPLDLPRLKALGIAVALPLPLMPIPASPLLVDASSPVDDADAAGSEPGELHGGIRLLIASGALADPRLGLLALAANREPVADGAEDTPVNEAALAAAINAYTRTAAWASGDERRRGTIARDKLADIVILSADLFTLPADKLLDAVVTTTIFDGKVVYDRDADERSTEP